jgi:hypothetical protein
VQAGDCRKDAGEGEARTARITIRSAQVSVLGRAPSLRSEPQVHRCCGDLCRQNAPNDIDEPSEVERLREHIVRLTERSIVHPVSQEKDRDVVPSPARASDKLNATQREIENDQLYWDILQQS